MVFAMLTLCVFVFGLIVGSFLNVCIHRLPLDESIVRPRSRCPHCRERIRATDNVPLISYLLLRGRCRSCGAQISARYPLVELSTGVIAVLSLHAFGTGLEAFAAFVFLAALLTVSLIDLDHFIIPDVISLPGIAAGLLFSFLLGQPGWRDSLIGAAAGWLSLWLVAGAYRLLTGREGMGLGDAKLLAMIGAFLGWKALPLTVLVSSLAGTVVGAGMILFRGHDAQVPIPYGPFLAGGAVVAMLFGQEIVSWYVNFFVMGPWGGHEVMRS